MKLSISILSLGLIFTTSNLVFAQSAEIAKNSKQYENKEELESYLEEDHINDRVNPMPNQPLANYSGQEASRYRTDQGWSRSSYGSWWWGGGRSSDLGTTGYTTPSSSR